MFFNKKSIAGDNRLPVEPSEMKIHGTHLVKEAWWLGLVLVGVYLASILATYAPQDPSWSHMASEDAVVQNAGGAVGAWVSDMLLYLFGFSAWWWVVLAFYSMWLVYKRLGTTISERPFLLFNLVGFCILLLSCSAFESGHLLTLPATLPLAQGGMIGNGLDSILRAMFGFAGSTMVLLILMAVGFSLFTGWSWIMLTEKLGAAVLAAQAWLVNQYYDRQDRKAGKQVEIKRDVFIEAERKRTEDRPPIEIKVPELEIAKSERVLKERQTVLFESMPDSDLPPLHLLDEANGTVELQSAETLDFTSRLIERKLVDFGIEVKVLSAQPGPVITRYEFEPAPGVKGSQITNLAKDLARALSVVSIRVVETIPGKSCMGLEIPNPKRQIVFLSEIMGSQVYADMHSPLAIAMGKDIAGKPVVADLAKMPHVLVAGTTGSGKSVAINALILSLLYKAEANKVRMILIDPKMLELSVYEGIPHLLAPVVTDMRQAANALNWCVAEMERRYKLMSMLGVRNLAGYNQKIVDAKKAGTAIPHPFSLTPDDPEPLDEMPLIVVVIDELADLMMVVGKKVEELIARLAQKARAS
ncbi:MAG TPA: DNA translocase FtsK 4TM domain-containing protein, partial [Methylophilus sp.]